MQQMATDIRSIKEACGEQSEWSMQIYGSIDAVRESTQSNLASAKIMETGVVKLLSQTDMLKKEIRQLQISARKENK